MYHGNMNTTTSCNRVVVEKSKTVSEGSSLNLLMLESMCLYSTLNIYTSAREQSITDHAHLICGDILVRLTILPPYRTSPETRQFTTLSHHIHTIGSGTCIISQAS